MKTRAIAVLLALLIPAAAFAQVAVHTVDETDIFNGYMNVFELDGTYAGWGSPWGFGDLVFYYNGDGTMTMEPNQIGDPDPYWYIGGGGPGAAGNKLMEANGYAEVLGGGYAGRTVTLSVEVLSNTLTEAHTVKLFIKDFAGDFGSFVEESVMLEAPGVYSITLDAIDDPTRVVQWGFQMYGVNVWVTDVGQFGNMVVGPAPGVVEDEDMSFGDLKAMYR